MKDKIQEVLELAAKAKLEYWHKNPIDFAVDPEYWWFHNPQEDYDAL